MLRLLFVRNSKPVRILRREGLHYLDWARYIFFHADAPSLLPRSLSSEWWSLKVHVKMSRFS
jgi:hypothetical protein